MIDWILQTDNREDACVAFLIGMCLLAVVAAMVLIRPSDSEPAVYVIDNYRCEMIEND